jgi:hypothetical protein
VAGGSESFNTVAQWSSPPSPSTEAEAFSSARLKLPPKPPRFELLARDPSQVSTGTMSSRAGSQVLHPPPSHAVSGQFTSWPPMLALSRARDMGFSESHWPDPAVSSEFISPEALTFKWVHPDGWLV